MKHFNEEAFKRDLEAVPFQICEIVDDPEDSYWALVYHYGKVVDEHAPIKEKPLRPTGVLYMNNEWRKTIFLTLD